MATRLDAWLSGISFTVDEASYLLHIMNLGHCHGSSNFETYTQIYTVNFYFTIASLKLTKWYNFCKVLISEEKCSCPFDFGNT